MCSSLIGSSPFNLFTSVQYDEQVRRDLAKSVYSKSEPIYGTMYEHKGKKATFCEKAYDKLREKLKKQLRTAERISCWS